MKKNKTKNLSNESEDEDFNEEDDESIYEDEFIQHDLSGEEYPEELHSYRNNNNI